MTNFLHCGHPGCKDPARVVVGMTDDVQCVERAGQTHDCCDRGHEKTQTLELVELRYEKCTRCGGRYTCDEVCSNA